MDGRSKLGSISVSQSLAEMERGEGARGEGSKEAVDYSGLNITSINGRVARLRAASDRT
jgi:hypothetical protein